MNDQLKQRIRDKEQAYLARKAGMPKQEQPTKQPWWETEKQEGGE